MGLIMADATLCSITDKLNTQLCKMEPVLRGLATPRDVRSCSVVLSSGFFT